MLVFWSVSVLWCVLVFWVSNSVKTIVSCVFVRAVRSMGLVDRGLLIISSMAFVSVSLSGKSPSKDKVCPLGWLLFGVKGSGATNFVLFDGRFACTGGVSDGFLLTVADDFLGVAGAWAGKGVLVLVADWRAIVGLLSEAKLV